MTGLFSQRLRTATRYALFEQARNRFALGLLIIFVPLWYALFGSIVPSDPLAFKFWATGALLEVNGQNLIYITAGLNAMTLIIGFMFFASCGGYFPDPRRTSRFARASERDEEGLSPSSR